MMKLAKLIRLGIVAAASALCVSSAVAHLDYSSAVEYYSDASLSTQVGFSFTACNGRTTSTGIMTPYTFVDEEPCGDGR